MKHAFTINDGKIWTYGIDEETGEELEGDYIGDTVEVIGKKKEVLEWVLRIQFKDPEGNNVRVSIAKKHLIGRSKKPLQILFSKGWDGNAEMVEALNQYLLEQFKTATIIREDA